MIEAGILRWLRAALCGVIASAGAIAGLAAPALAEEQVKMSAFQGTFVNFPVYVAQDLKLFEKRGVKVELVFGRGIQVATIMASGATELGAFAVEHAVQIVSKGQDVKLLVLNQTQPPFNLIVRNDVPTPNVALPFIDRMHDLKGLRLGVSSIGASSDLTLRYLLILAGMDPQADVKIVPLGDPPTQVAGVKNGLADGVLAIEPAQIEAVLGLKIAKPVLDIEEGEGPDIFHEYAYNAVFARPAYIAAHPDTVRAVIAAIVEAEQIINDPAHIDDVMKVVDNNMRGLDPALLRAYVEKYRHIWTPVATRKSIENVNTLLIGAKQITEPVLFDRLVAKDFMPRDFAPLTH